MRNAVGARVLHRGNFCTGKEKEEGERERSLFFPLQMTGSFAKNAEEGDGANIQPSPSVLPCLGMSGSLDQSVYEVSILPDVSKISYVSLT